MKINEAIKDYILEIQIRKYSPITVRTYKSKLNHFAAFCNEKDVAEMEDLSMAIIKRYTQAQIERGMTGVYINTLLKTIKSFVQYCYDEGYGGFNTTRNQFRWVKEQKPVITTFNKKQIKLLINNCKGSTFRDIRDMAIIVTFLETGIRCTELCNIKLEDIHENHITIMFGKNHKSRVVPITPILNKALMRYNRVRESYFGDKHVDPQFFLSYRGRQFNNSSIEKVINKRSVGIEGVRTSPHTLRHTWAQAQLKMGTDIYTISRLCGHENIRTTQIYLESLRDEEVIQTAQKNSVLMNL